MCKIIKYQNNHGFAMIWLAVVLCILPILLLASVKFLDSTENVKSLFTQSTTKERMENAKKFIIMNALDVDSDNYYEVYREAVPNLLSTKVTVISADEWGTAFKYCTWDLGSLNTVDLVNYTDNNVAPPISELVFRIISAGSDKTFQTSCTDAATSGDDIVLDAYHRDLVGFWGAKVADSIPSWLTPKEPTVKLLIHADSDTDNSTYIYDSSLFNRSIKLVGSPVIKTGIKKFGTGSLYFNGNSYLAIYPTNQKSDLEIGRGNYTFEAWVYPTSNSGSYQIIAAIWPYGVYAGAFLWRNPANAELCWNIDNNEANPWDVWLCSTGSTVPLNTWTHIAATAIYNQATDTNTFKIFINGVMVNSVQKTNFWSFYNNPTIDRTRNMPFTIGGAIGGGVNGSFYGYMDEVKLTKRPLWSTLSGFTPYTTPYGDNTYTCSTGTFNSKEQYECEVNCTQDVTQTENCVYEPSSVTLSAANFTDSTGQYHWFQAGGNTLLPALWSGLTGAVMPSGSIIFSANASGITVSSNMSQTGYWTAWGNANTLRWYTNMYFMQGEASYQGRFIFSYDSNKNVIVSGGSFWVNGLYQTPPYDGVAILYLHAPGTDNCMYFYDHPNGTWGWRTICLTTNKTWQCPLSGGSACSGGGTPTCSKVTTTYQPCNKN